LSAAAAAAATGKAKSERGADVIAQLATTGAAHRPGKGQKPPPETALARDPRSQRKRGADTPHPEAPPQQVQRWENSYYLLCEPVGNAGGKRYAYTISGHPGEPSARKAIKRTKEISSFALQTLVETKTSLDIAGKPRLFVSTDKEWIVTLAQRHAATNAYPGAVVVWPGNQGEPLLLAAGAGEA